MYDGVVSRENKGTDKYVWPVRGGYIDAVKYPPPPPTATFFSENLPDNSYQVGATTKSWRFKTGVNPITGLKAVQVSADWGLGIEQYEIAIGDVAANTEFLVNLPINPTHDASDVKTSNWKLVDGNGQDVTISNSSSGQFWLKLKTNRPPVFSQLQLESVSGTTGQPLCLPLMTSDPDNDALTYSVLSGGGSVVDGTCMGKTGKIYQNSSPAAGVTAVKLQISDSAAATATKDIYTVVINENGAVKDFFNDLKYANATTVALKDQYKAINYLAMNGIAIGVVDPNDPNGRIFELNTVTKQAEALGMIMKAAARLGRLELDAEERNLPNLIKIDTAAMTYQNFSWAAPYVLKAEELGMLDSAETFDPAAPVTRAWLAKMVYNLMELDPPTDALNPAAYIFSDAASFTSTEEYDAARAAAFFGYMGSLGSAFNPNDSMIRADVAVVTARILQTPALDGFGTVGLADQTIFDRTLPATTHGNSFTVNGLTNLTGKTALMDSNGYVTEGTTVPAQTKVAVIRLGYGVTAENIMANTLAASPVTVATNPPDISSTEIRSLLLLIEDTVSGVRAISRKEYGVIFPDADGDGVRDNLDVWASNPLFSIDANNNGIPDNADALWGLSNRQGSEMVTINGQQMTLVNAVLNNLYYPSITTFTLPATVSSLNVPVTSFEVAGGVSPYSYCLTTINDVTSCSWNSTRPDSYSFNLLGTYTLYAFVKDADGNVSSVKSATVNVSFIQSALNENFDAKVVPPGWVGLLSSGANWWFIDQSSYNLPNTTGGSGGYALAATYSVTPTPASYAVYLYTPLLNLASYGSVVLEFKINKPVSDIADVEVSTSGAAGPWTSVWNKNSVFTGPQTVSVDISSIAAGNSAVLIRFRHYGATVWMQLDDVKVTGSLLSQLPLAVTVSGNGKGTVTSNPAGLSCNSGTCNASFNTGSTITLTAIPEASSVFGGWSGTACSGTGDCTVTMDTDKGIGALFNPAPKVRILRDTSLFDSLFNAGTTAQQDDVLQMLEDILPLNWIVTKRLVFRGGYAAGFSSQPGYTTLTGGLTIGSGGSVVVDRIVVK